jgi:hypothetical protein
MMRDVPFANTHLWNDLPFDERKRLHPYMVETHILHLEQMRTLMVAHHTKALAELDRQIENLKRELRN